MTVYQLTCEDASHLGGPMGTEYTTHLWSKPFSTVAKAKRAAAKFAERKLEWKISSSSKTRRYCDAGAYIFTIDPEKVD